MRWNKAIYIHVANINSNEIHIKQINNSDLLKMMCGKNCNSIVVGLVILGVWLGSHPVLATTYTVGDSSGWRFNVAGWENGKYFKAGDGLGTYVGEFITFYIRIIINMNYSVNVTINFLKCSSTARVSTMSWLLTSPATIHAQSQRVPKRIIRATTK